jgi:hypothetical protein
MQTSNTFTPGSYYTHNYIGDSNLYVIYTVIRRTAKSVWVSKVSRLTGENEGEVKMYRVKESSHGQGEYISLGSYSMAPVLRAAKKVERPGIEVKKIDIVADMGNSMLTIPGEGSFTFVSLGIMVEYPNRKTILNNVMPLVDTKTHRVHFINERTLRVV